MLNKFTMLALVACLTVSAASDDKHTAMDYLMNYLSVLSTWLTSIRQLAMNAMATQTPQVTALVAGAVVTCTPLLMIVFLPVRRLPSTLLSMLVGFGVGTLLGDVMLHILPMIFAAASTHSHTHDDGHRHEHSHDDSAHHGHSHGDPAVPLAVLAGMAFFILVDKSLRSMFGGHSHDHSHDHREHQPTSDLHMEPIGHSTATNSHSDTLRSRHGQQVKSIHSQSDQHSIKKTSTSGLLTLMATISHTFSDGLTLGFAHFTASPEVAFSTTLAILMHEIPHKLSDYAILLKSGYSPLKALMLQLLSVSGTFAGIGVAIWINSLASGDEQQHASSMVGDFSKFIIPFTAGGLLYTATVGILGEIVEHSGFIEFLLQLVSAALGVGMMQLTAMAE